MVLGTAVTDGVAGDRHAWQAAMSQGRGPRAYPGPGHGSVNLFAARHAGRDAIHVSKRRLAQYHGGSLHPMTACLDPRRGSATPRPCCARNLP